MGVCFHPHSNMKAFTSVLALVAAATAAPVANLVGGHAGLVGGHGLVSGPGAFVGGHGGLVGGVGHGVGVGHGLVGGAGLGFGGVGHGVVGGFGHGVAVGGGQVSHQSVHKPLQGENRGVTQSKAFGSPVAAVADLPSTTHGVGSNRVRTVGVVSSGLVGHGGLVGGVGHGVVGGFGHGVGVGHGLGHGLVGGVGLGGVYNGYTGYNGTPFLNAALVG